MSIFFLSLCLPCQIMCFQLKNINALPSISTFSLGNFKMPFTKKELKVSSETSLWIKVIPWMIQNFFKKETQIFADLCSLYHDQMHLPPSALKNLFLQQETVPTIWNRLVQQLKNQLTWWTLPAFHPPNMHTSREQNVCHRISCAVQGFLCSALQSHGYHHKTVHWVGSYVYGSQIIH